MGILLNFPSTTTIDHPELPDDLLNFARLEGESKVAMRRRFKRLCECHGFHSARSLRDFGALDPQD